MITLNLSQAKQLVAFFGDCEEHVSISEGEGHEGHGVYAASAAYPEEGSIFLDPSIDSETIES